MQYTITEQTIEVYGRTFHRMTAEWGNAGWIEAGASLPEDTNARVYDDTLIFAKAAKNTRGGWFHGGEFHDGAFHGGWFYDGWFYDGTFRGGAFRGGKFRGGEFYDGWFYGGEFHGGAFHGGAFRGGTFHGGAFHASPCCAQRHDGWMFVAKYVGEELRIWAGCHNFSWEEAVAHWNDDHRHGAESQRIIHFLKAQAEAERERDAQREQA